MSAETGGYRAVDPSSSAGGLCALVLGGAPIVRAGIAYLLQREYARSRIVTAEWQARERVLAEAAEQLDLVVAWVDSDMHAEACWEFASRIGDAGVVIVTPPSACRAPEGMPTGLVCIPYGASLHLWRKALHLAARRRAPSGRARAVGSEAPARLTARQLEVLEMLQMGLSNKHIANRLSLSVGTVKLHVGAVLRAMQAKNRMNLVLRRAAALNALRAGDDSLA